MSSERKEVNLPSGTVSYFAFGAGRKLLYLHGAEGLEMTKPLEALARRHAVYLPLLPGFYETASHARVRTMPELADLVAAFAKVAIGEPADVLGAAFGARLALWLALRHPDRVAQLVLASPSGPGLGEAGDEALAAQIGTIAARTLALVGTRDETGAAQTARLLKARLPHSHLVYLYDAARALERDQPERFLRVVDAFLARGEAFIVNWAGATG
jgi:pimeloyl-ACP methyl ester carboxylesterase